MMKSLQVLTKVKMGWGEMPVGQEKTVRVKTAMEKMSLGELLYWALMGDGEAVVRG